MKFIKRLFIMLIILLAIIVLARNVIVKHSIHFGSKQATGLEMNVDSVDMGLTASAAGIKGFTIENPKGFPDGTIISVPEVYIDYDHTQILGDTIHLQEVRLDIDTVNVIKNSKGQINVMEAMNALNEHFKSGLPSSGDEQPGEKKPSKALQIDRLKLKIGKVRVTDQTVNPPTVKDITINLDEEFDNVTSPVAVGVLIATKTMMAAGINLLSAADMNMLKQMGSGYSGSAQKMAQDTLDKTKEVTDQMLGTNALNNSLNKAGDALKGIFK